MGNFVITGRGLITMAVAFTAYSLYDLVDADDLTFATTGTLLAIFLRLSMLTHVDRDHLDDEVMARLQGY